MMEPTEKSCGYAVGDQAALPEGKKKIPFFKYISIVYFLFLGLYIVGAFACGVTELEYRLWAWALGNSALFLGFPIWVFICWLRWHRKHGSSKILRYAVIAVSAAAYLFWCCLFFIVTIFSMEDEHILFGDYLSVNRGKPFAETEYYLCKSVAFAFRKDAERNTAFDVEYLEQKYGQDFLEVPFDEEGMLFYDMDSSAAQDFTGSPITCEEKDYVETIQSMRDGDGRPSGHYGETVAVPADNPLLPVAVVMIGGNLEDDYLDLLTSFYITKACMHCKIDRDVYISESGDVDLLLSGEEDVEAAAKDVQQIIRYALQDPIYQENRGMVRLSLDFDSVLDTVYVPFGKLSIYYDKMEEDYYQDTAFLTEYIMERYETVTENRQSRLVQEEAYKKQQEAETGEEAQRNEEAGEAARQDEESAEDTQLEEESLYAKEGRRIFEEELEPAGIGDSFTVSYSAKGAEYYNLGADGEFSYTLLYDRDSQNGACRLYVLYRSPYNQETEGYDSYTSSSTQIMDIYAVVKDDGSVISSGRTAWADVGNKEYREATGE